VAHKRHMTQVWCQPTMSRAPLTQILRVLSCTNIIVQTCFVQTHSMQSETQAHRRESMALVGPVPCQKQQKANGVGGPRAKLGRGCGAQMAWCGVPGCDVARV
jgi:hypothetical protein